MAHYLVSARPTADRIPHLRAELQRGAFLSLEPFGRALSHSLTHARWRSDGVVVWEEEDYCSPPLAQERAAVLDEYFEGLQVRPVQRGMGWAEIRDLPPLFPELSDEAGR